MFQPDPESRILGQFLPASIPASGELYFIKIDRRHREQCKTLLAEMSGAALLAETDFCQLKNCHLELGLPLFESVACDEISLRERIGWMINARTASTDEAIANRAEEAVQLIADQLGWPAELGKAGREAADAGPDYTGGFDPDELAADLAELAQPHADIVQALFRGDLAAVPDMIDLAGQEGGDTAALVSAAAAMLVVWALLELQRESCLGWRLLHRPLDGACDLPHTKTHTIGQVLRPSQERHHFAESLSNLFERCADRNVDGIFDKREINSIEARAEKHGYGWLNRKNGAEIIAMFGHPSAKKTAKIVAAARELAYPYLCRRDDLMRHPDGSTRAAQKADMLLASISSVHRVAIVAARVIELSERAVVARTPGDLRATLNSRIPDVLRPCEARKSDPRKLRHRQLFYIYRVEFLRDGEHVPKNMKGSDLSGVLLPMELTIDQERRGHQATREAWRALNKQPGDWRFITPFGWQCDSDEAIRTGYELTRLGR